MSDFSKPIDILGTFADPLAFEIGGAKLVNCRPMLRDPREGKPGRVRLVGTPGLTIVSQPSTYQAVALGRALQTVWSIHQDGSVWYDVHTPHPVHAGTISLATGTTIPVVRVAEDITGLAIASNGNAYLATKSGVLNGNFGSTYGVDPTTVCELDNTTIWGGLSPLYAAGNILKMYSSQKLAPLTLTGAFASKEARADALLDLATTQRTYWALGAQSIEHFYDSGSGADFSFIPFTNSLTPIGLGARNTLASVHDNIVFVGTDKRVWFGTAQTATPLGIEWVDFMMQQIAVSPGLTSLHCHAYSHGGADYYVMSLEGFWTVEININTKTANYVASFGRPDSTRSCALEYEKAVTFVGCDTGHICVLDITSSSEPTGPMSRAIVSQYIGDLTTRHTIDAVTVTSSLGAAAGTFDFDWSEDGFVTSKGARTITMPEPGKRRAIARQLGESRRRQIRLRYAGTVAPFEFDEIFVEGSQGA